MDAQQVSDSSCTCATNSQMRIHNKPENKRTNSSFPCSNCHCPLSSMMHTRRRTECSHRTNNVLHHLHIKQFSYWYFLLCVLFMVTSVVSLESIIIEDQQTQVGHFFFYNISTNSLPLKESSKLKAFEAGKDSLPEWLLFDDTLATFSGVPMDNDEGNIFIEVNVLENDQLILDEIFSIEVRPADAILLSRKLSKSFLHKLTNSGLSDGTVQQSVDEDVPEQKTHTLGQSLHFLPSHCPALSNELIGNLLLRSTTQLTHAQWVKLFTLLSDSLGVPVNKLYIRNMMYENLIKKALLWGHYVGSDSLVDAPINKTLTLMSFLIGCSKDSVYSDIYRVIIERANALLESVGEDSLLSVFERWFITMEGDDSTEAQKLHQRRKRQNAVGIGDVQQPQDIFMVHTTATTEMVTTSIAAMPTSVLQPVTTVSVSTFSSVPILTTTITPVMTILPSSPVLSVEPTTMVIPMLTSSLFSADQTTLDITQSFITPIISSVSLVESISISTFTSIESSLPPFLTSPSVPMIFSTSLFVTTATFELPSTSFSIGIASVPLSMPLSSLTVSSSFITDVVITPSVTSTSFEPTSVITTSSLLSSTEVSMASTILVVTTTFVEPTSVILTLLPSTSIPVSSVISVPVSSASISTLFTVSSVPVATSSPLLTDIDTSMFDTLTVTPTSVFSLIVTPSSSEFSLSTQSDIIIASSPVFTDVIIPTTVVSIDDTTIPSFPSVMPTSVSLAVSSIMATPAISTTPLLDTTLLETPTSFTPMVTITALPSTTVETTLFSDMPTFSPVETVFTPTPSTIISDDISLFTIPSVTSSSSLFIVSTLVSTSTLATPIFNVSSAIIVTPSSAMVDTFTTEVPNITLSISDTDVITLSTTAVNVTDTLTNFVPPLTSQIPVSPSFISSSSLEPPSFTTLPSLDISSMITSSVPSLIVIDSTFTSIADVSGTIFTLPATPTFAVTVITSEVTSDIISPTTTLSFIETVSFTPSPVTSLISAVTSIETTIDDVSSFSPSPDITSTITPSVTLNLSSVSILPSAASSEVILTTTQPDVSTTIIPVTTFSEVISTSENVTITPPFTSIIPSPSVISPSISLAFSTSESVTITLPATTIIPTPSVISPSIPSVASTSEVTTQPDVSSAITLSVTLTTNIINSSELPLPSTMLPSITPSPSVISLSTLPVVSTSEVVTTTLPDITTISFVSPSMSDVINSSTVVTIISPSASIVTTSSLILSSITTSEVVSPTVITVTDTDTPSITISPITTSSSVFTSVINMTDIVPSSSTIVVTPTPTNVSSIVTMSPSVTTANTSELVSPSPSFTETSSITLSVTSTPTSSTTLIIVNTTDVMLSSQVLTPNVTSDVLTTAITTDATSMVTRATTQIDVTSSITPTETSEFTPTITFVSPTMVTPSLTVSFTSTMIATPTPTITNQAPQLVNPIRPLTWQEGQSAMYEIPEDTFYDRESGSTSNLSLILQTLPGQLVSNTSWIQLIDGVFYGLPLNEQIENSTVTEYVFILTAQDSQNAEVHDFVVILVEPQDPLITNLITFFVEGDFDLFNQQFIEKTRLIDRLISFGPTNATDDVYIRDLFNGSIGVQYGNRTIQNSDCMGFAALLESIFNNETFAYSNNFATALLPFNVTKMPRADGPCYSTVITPVTTPPDLASRATEERSSTKFLATIIPGVAVTVILLLIALFACILYRCTHPSREHYTFVKRNPIVLEVEDQNRPHRAHRPVVLPEDTVDGAHQHNKPPRKMTEPPKDERKPLIPQCDPPPYRLPLVYKNYAAIEAPSEDRQSSNLPYQFT